MRWSSSRLTLRMSLVLVAVVALLCAWPGRWIYERMLHRRAISAVSSHGGSVQFGERGYSVVFGKADLAHLRAFPDAGALDLVGSGVVDADLVMLRGFPSLRLLNLSNCRISDNGVASLKDLRNLEYLFLAGTNITDEGLKHLGGLDNLEILLLDHTRVGDAGLAHLGRLSKLRELSLWETGVGAEAIPHLKRLTGLKSINVPAEPANSGLVEAFQKGLSGVTVYSQKIPVPR